MQCGAMPNMEFHGRNFCRYHVLIFENDNVREPDMETLQFLGSSASHFVDDISVKEDFWNFIDMHLFGFWFNIFWFEYKNKLS